MNILTTNGYVGRFVTDWAGPDATIRKPRDQARRAESAGRHDEDDAARVQGRTHGGRRRRSRSSARTPGAITSTGRSRWRCPARASRGNAWREHSRTRPPSSASGRPSSRRTPGARSSSSRARPCARRSRDAGLKPSDVDGMTTFTLDTSDDIEVARSVGIGDLTFFSRIAARRRRGARHRPSGGDGGRDGRRRGRRLLPRAERSLGPALQPGRRGRHRHERSDPLELVHARSG